MRRIAIIGIVAATAVFGAINSSSAETTMPMQDLALVSESSGVAPSDPGTRPEGFPGFQFGRFQQGHFQFGRFQQGGKFQFGRFQFGRFQFGRFQHGGKFQFGRFQFGRFQFPHRGI